MDFIKTILSIIFGLLVMAVPLIIGFLLLSIFFKSCGSPDDNAHNKDKTEQTYEDGMRKSIDNSQLDPVSEQYLSNSLSTGECPYDNKPLKGHKSEIKITTSPNSDCDVVAIIKHNGEIVRNAYIKAGDAYTFSIPNGEFQVFFYGGKGWNPEKIMSGVNIGGFVTNETFSKDSPVTIHNQILEYQLILQQNGNFSTEPSNQKEIF